MQAEAANKTRLQKDAEAAARAAFSAKLREARASLLARVDTLQVQSTL